MNMHPVSKPALILLTLFTASLSKLDEVSLVDKAMPAGAEFAQIGTASWYGPGFEGKKTASGTTFRQNEMTAAHRTLPLGTQVDVTNLANGVKVSVAINDRGPYVEGRIIDLSRAAADKLGIVRIGTGLVKVEAELFEAAAR